MSSTKLTVVLLSFIVLGIGGVVLHRAQGDDAPKPKVEKPVNQELRAFMRTKLKASNQILEGLALEDMALIEEGAKTLAEMSSVEKWRVSQDAMYRQFSTEFTRNANKLVEAAKERNIDRAALRWMDTTMSCLECHRFVRNELVVQKP